MHSSGTPTPRTSSRTSSTDGRKEAPLVSISASEWDHSGLLSFLAQAGPVGRKLSGLLKASQNLHPHGIHTHTHTTSRGPEIKKIIKKNTKNQGWRPQVKPALFTTATVNDTLVCWTVDYLGGFILNNAVKHIFPSNTWDLHHILLTLSCSLLFIFCQHLTINNICK